MKVVTIKDLKRVVENFDDDKTVCVCDKSGGDLSPVESLLGHDGHLQLNINEAISQEV